MIVIEKEIDKAWVLTKYSRLYSRLNMHLSLFSFEAPDKMKIYKQTNKKVFSR